MKKLISVILTLAMIASALSAMTITAGANGSWSGWPTWNGDDGGEGIDYVEALYFENEPTIDGYVTDAEWGERTIEMYSEECAMGTMEPYYNSFFYWKNQSHPSEYYPMAALVWLRWDENYFYVAAIVRDYDGHSLKHSQSETWNGDAIEFRVDSDGPNSATYGDAYDPYIGTPWRNPSKVPAFTVGYVQIAGGFTEVFEHTTRKGLTAYSKPAFGDVKAVVAPAEDLFDDKALNYHEDSISGYTTYEIAIPWKYIFELELLYQPSLTEAQKAPYTVDYSEYSAPTPSRPGRPSNPGNPTGGIGRVLGMSLTVLNAAKGENTYNAFMNWGSGVTNVQEEIAPYTCAGSNQVTLVAESVEQGDYAKYDPSKLNASTANKVYDSVFYDYLGGDLDCTNPLGNVNELTTLTYDDKDDMDYWGSAELFQGSIIDVGGDHGNVLNYDRVIITHTDDDGKIHQAGIDPIDQFYIDTTIGYSDYGAPLGGQYPLSYTFEFDVMYTGLETVQEGRMSELGNIFGGSSAEYYCGYSFADKCFVIRSFSDPTNVIARSSSFDLKKDTWYNWKFQYDNDTCTMRLLIDDEVIFNVNNRYFYYSSDYNLENGTVLCWWFINTQMKMDNVRIYNFYDYVGNDPSDPDEPSVPSYPVGDVDKNGKVNAFDVIYVKRGIVGLIEEGIDVDVNGDGLVTAKDLLIVKKIIIG